YRLGPGDRLVAVVHRLLHGGPQVGVVHQLGDGAGLVVLLLPELEGFRVDGDERGDELAVVADDHALADDRVAADPVLDDRGGDVLPACGDDDLLLPPGDPQEAFLVEFADVAAAVPAVLGERLLRRLRVVPVAAHHVVALDEDLPVVGDPDRRAGDGAAHRADLVGVGGVRGGGGGRLGQTVAFQDGQADPAAEVAAPLTQGGTTGDGVLGLPAHRSQDLAVDEQAEHGALETQPQAHLPGVQRLAVGDGGLRGLPEDVALATGDGLLLSLVVDLLEHAGHGKQEHGAERSERVQQVRAGGGEVAHDGLRLHAADLDDAGQRVRQREEQEGGAPLHGEDVLHGAAVDAHDVEGQVALGELAAFGTAGGARGVDQGGEVVEAGGGAALLHHRVSHVRAGGDESGEAVAFDLHDAVGFQELCGDSPDSFRVLVVLHEGERASRVAEDPLDLLFGGGVEDGDGHSADGPDGVVDDGPLVAGPRHERYPVAVV